MTNANLDPKDKELIEAFCKKNIISQEQLARELKISPRTIYAWKFRPMTNISRRYRDHLLATWPYRSSLMALERALNAFPIQHSRPLATAVTELLYRIKQASLICPIEDLIQGLDKIAPTLYTAEEREKLIEKSKKTT